MKLFDREIIEFQGGLLGSAWEANL
jgi:hypothetical protein